MDMPSLPHDRGSVGLALLSNLKAAGNELGPSNDTSAALNVAAYLADRIEADQAKSGGGIPEVSGRTARPTGAHVHWADNSSYLTGRYLLEAAALLPLLARTKPNLTPDRLTGMALRILDCAVLASRHGPARALPSQSTPTAPFFPAKQRAWEPQLAYHTMSTAGIVRLCDLLADRLTDAHRTMADGMADWLESLAPNEAGDYATFYSMHDGKTPVYGTAHGDDVFDVSLARSANYHWHGKVGVKGALKHWRNAI